MTQVSERSNNFKFSEEFIQEALNHFFAINSVKYNIDGLYVFGWESDKLLETKSGYIYDKHGRKPTALAVGMNPVLNRI